MVEKLLTVAASKRMKKYKKLKIILSKSSSEEKLPRSSNSSWEKMYRPLILDRKEFKMLMGLIVVVGVRDYKDKLHSLALKVKGNNESGKI